MKNTSFLTFIFGLLFICYQTTDLNGQSVDYIKSSGEYYFGIGNGRNYQQARRTALELLSESISVQIQSEFKQVVEETGEDVNIYTQSVVNTYSTAVVNRYDDKLIKEEPGDVDVIVYVLKSEMHAAFEQRVQMIEDFILLAVKATDQVRMADALRYYFWGLVLARSHPDNTKLRSKFGGDNELPLMLELTDRINNVFSQINVQISKVEESETPPGRNLYLDITYKGNPVQDLDYTYFVGDGYSGLYSANNGKGFAEFYGPTAKDLNRLRMRIEYEYRNKADLAPEVKMMLENVDIPYFKRAEFIINLDERDVPKPSDNLVQPLMSKDTPSTYSVDNYNYYEHAVRRIADAIDKSNHESLIELFTPAGYSMYEKLIANGQVKILGLSNDSLKMIKVGKEVMVRSVPMLFAFENNREKFIENVVFTFDEQKKVNGISYSLTDIAVNDIISKPENFGTEEEKYFLIKFMEDFKTAYSLKRLDYLDAIFDENALIIVGNVVKRSEEPVENVQSMYGNLSNDEIEYIRLSKKDYIERLHMIFRRNEFINIRFEDNQVKKTQKDDKVYGIQINQYYYSSTYADKGYLFLMIDLNDTLNPRVYVRTWQPQKNPDGSVYGLGDFRF